jgi:hypothetical protein
MELIITNILLVTIWTLVLVAYQVGHSERRN